MVKIIGKWAAFLPLGLVAAIMMNMTYVHVSEAETPVRNELRMSVDFTVLPMVLPDGNETPAQQAMESDLGEPEAISPPEGTQATVIPEPSAPEPEMPKPAPPAHTEQDAQMPGKVEAIAITENDTGFTISIRTDVPVADTSYINLTDPQRLVLDLIGPWEYHAKNVIRLDGLIKHVVVGEHPDRLRLVVHFRTPPTGPLNPIVTTTDTVLTAAVTVP
ncbi:AMIN domain-containing protein [uncultured Pseudodesulfovibrio sp.]|uniref:AMIN domain-containing protein n=1 Tax=uncultured Pseudodesulfovibrio sp. TaxID=2035858 RepID=UPI0029C808F3|nr:AMIN domain-containing protein [uncultured Pseudodesulfovibrio sp.]